MSGNRAIQEIKFHSSATSQATGLECQIVSDASTINIDFIDKAEGSIFAAVIEGKVSFESDWDEIMSVNTKTYTMTTTPNTMDTYQCDITGWSYIRCRLTSVTGSITCLGRLVG